jgi:demethylmenaquinone methyltransferase / 2-methoxy-6-polyprenyl-1,4-benzoquinol methylase
MGNKFYVPGQQRAAKVKDLFGAIAPRYDLINDLQSFGLHRLWKRRLVKLARLGPGQRGLDLCCGTGDVAFRLARTGAEVVGLDFSEAMLAVARKRMERAAGTVQFLAGDAMSLPFPDGHFDAVTVAYGLRNLSSWETGLREMWRVAKPGGRLVVLDFGKPDQPLWRSIYFAWLRWVIPIFGRLFCRDASLYAYILESLQHYPAQHGVAAAMRDLGCADVRILSLLGGIMTINHGVKG